MSIRVLHLIESLGLGGAERRLLNDLTYLEGRRIQSHVATVFGADDLREGISSLGVPVVGLGLVHLRQLGRGVRPLADLVRRQKIQILHTQLFPADMLGRLVKAVSPSLRLVTTLQSSVYEPHTPYLYSARRRFIDAVTGRLWNDRWVAVSRFVRDSAVRRLGVPRQKISVIPNSVNLSGFEPLTESEREVVRRREGVPGKPMVWVAVGRLDGPKNHEVLLQALALAQEGTSDQVLWVVGEGPLSTSLQTRAKQLKLEGVVRFLGARRDVRDLVGAADVLVSGSLSEGLPLTVVEAMALARPCVLSDIGPHRELVGPKDDDGGRSAGILFDARRPASLAQAVSEIRNDADRARQMGQTARSRAVRTYDASLCAEQLAALYQEMAG